VDWIGKQAIKRTFASIAEEVGIALGVTRGWTVMSCADLSIEIEPFFP
jgi:hypothetical protein